MKQKTLLNESRLPVYLPAGLKNGLENRQGCLMKAVIKRVAAAEKQVQVWVPAFAPVEIAVRPFALRSG